MNLNIYIRIYIKLNLIDFFNKIFRMFSYVEYYKLNYITLNKYYFFT